MWPFDRLPLAAAAALLSAVLVAGIYAEVRLAASWPLAVAIAGVVVLAALFLRDYRTRPEAPPRPRRVPPGDPAGPAAVPGVVPPPPIEEIADEEDPVIEADKIASGEVLPSTVDGEEERSPDRDDTGEDAPGLAPAP